MRLLFCLAIALLFSCDNDHEMKGRQTRNVKNIDSQQEASLPPEDQDGDGKREKRKERDEKDAVIQDDPIDSTPLNEDIPEKTPKPSNKQTVPPNADSTKDNSPAKPSYNDPGSAPWQLVPADKVKEECKLDPDLLKQADQEIDKNWLVVRYGKLCHEFYPSNNPDRTRAAWSVTKTLGAVTFGVASYKTKDLKTSGPQTGPLSDLDATTHWLPENLGRINQNSKISHILGMVAYNDDLSLGNKTYKYDTTGSREINKLSNIIDTAVRQGSPAIANGMDDFVNKHVFGPLGIRKSHWERGRDNKTVGYKWQAVARDMARLGLLILHDGHWDGQQLMDPGYVYRLTHPSFEDANTGYGYLTWLNARENWKYVHDNSKQSTPALACAPVAINKAFPHGASKQKDCNYSSSSCDQTHDVGLWSAIGLGGQYIVGMKGFDMVIVVQDFGADDIRSVEGFWQHIRPALVAEDSTYQGDEARFCRDLSNNDYAPDLPRRTALYNQ